MSNEDVTVQTENFIRAVIELQPLLEEHWKELALFQDKVPLAPNWPHYYQLAGSNQLLFVTARNGEGKLLGYYIAIVTPCSHYFTTPRAQHDIMRVTARGTRKWHRAKA